MKFMSVTEKIIVTGRKLFELGLVGVQSGNISVLFNNFVHITRTGSQLGYLTYDDIVSFPVDSLPPIEVSMETVVHLSVYKNSSHTAVVHAHPPYLISLGFFMEKFSPIDTEGKYYLPEIPFFEAKDPIGSKEVAKIVGENIKMCPAVFIKTHGIFAAAKDLDSVLNLVSVAEKSARIFYNVKMFGRKNFA